MIKNKSKEICIVSPTYITSNPRVVKEADALRQAGFDVRVVFSEGNIEWARRYDAILLKGRQWKCRAVKWSPFRRKEKSLYWKSRIRYHIARSLPSGFYSFGKLVEHTQDRVYKELAELAASEKADLYIGHYPAGLAAASYAASRWGARLGYDVEDLHTEEGIPLRDRKRIELIESRYLPYCSHVTAVSELVADEIAGRYNIRRPLTIHNVFPWSERANIDGQIKDRRGRALSLYWYSQVIGEDRGIQDVIRAAGLLKEKVQIHLRGNVSMEVKKKFLVLTRQCGIEEKLCFHPPVLPAELLSRTAEHDIGLAIERSNSLNRILTVSNKLFFYLLAGLAVAATDVSGQRYVMSAYPDAGFLYKPGDYKSLADHINKLLLDPVKLQRCKEASIRAAHEQWNWEKESGKFIESISRLFKD